MSDARAVLVAAAAFFLGWGAAAGQSLPAAAEERGEEQAVLREGLRDLVARLLAAEARARRADSIAFVRIERPGAAAEAVRVGPLRILAAPEQAAEAAELFGGEWRRFEPLFGDRLDAVRQVTFTFQHGTSDAPKAVGHVRPVDLGVFASRAAASETIRGSLGSTLLEALPTQIAGWVGGLALEPPSAGGLARVRRDLLLSPSPSARACVDGGAAECWKAMGVIAPGADPIAEWYPPEERVLLVVRESASRRWEVTPTAAACAEHDLEACSAWLSDRLATGQLVPASTQARASLLWFALERGGTGAVGRMQDAIDSRSRTHSDWRSPETDVAAAGERVRTMLEAAAGTDAIPLMEAWQASLRASAADADPIQPRGRTRNAALLWIFLFAGLAARSTRWRLG